MTTREQAQAALQASKQLATLTEVLKNEVLQEVADQIRLRTHEIIEANRQDLVSYKGTDALRDRLTLTEERVEAMAVGCEQVSALTSQLGQEKQHQTFANGLDFKEIFVPLGVVGMIYEARPNVTVDGFALCFKTGNSVVLRGSKDAYESNHFLVILIREVLKGRGINPNAVVLLEDRSRQSVADMMQCRGLIDVIVPRGSTALIERVVKESWVPVIETGAGNCHLYVDERVDIEMALNIIENAKCQRVSVCNALESLVVHEHIVDRFIPKLLERIGSCVVCLGETTLTERFPTILKATEADWGEEYLDYRLSIKVVASVEEAIDHISCYHTHHSDGILTKNEAHAERFVEAIDSAVVYVNASTRFSDGFEFGLGAELGISTQKLHARGPMGLAALLTTKVIIRGTGQVRK